MAKKPDNENSRFAETIGEKSERRRRAARQKGRGLWFGIGMFGLVGWSVAIPALLLLALGIWIDSRWNSPWSWTLMLLVAGIALGCMNAWYWVKRESGEESRSTNNGG